jgi:CRISPR-associated endonuclease Cas1/group II intron reverse transcriptase/maturase
MTEEEAKGKIGFEQLLPVQGVSIKLTALESLNLPFFHQSTLSAFIRELNQGQIADYENQLWTISPETGGTEYAVGQPYHFHLLWASGADDCAAGLLSKIQMLPESAQNTSPKLHLRNNVRCNEISDYFSSQTVVSLDKLIRYDAASLQHELRQWRQYRHVTLRWQSPVRILKRLQIRKRHNLQGEQCFIAEADDIDGGLLLQRIADSLADLIFRRSGVKIHNPTAQPLPLASSHLFWVEHAYYDDAGNEKSMGGLTGTMELVIDNLTDDWLMLLILGQYYGIGRRRSFGWGRYRLESADGAHTLPDQTRPSSLLQIAMQPATLLKAWRHCADHAITELPELPAELDNGAPPLLDALNRAASELLADSYKTPPLNLWQKAKADGEYRILSIPPFLDRVLQRAVVETLSPGLDKLMSRHSHGFRRGYSRHTAGQEIRKAYQAGYRWVFEADIDNFFDCIVWAHLSIRLKALYGDDPIVQRIMDWVAAPAVMGGHPQTRRRGLPQGAPLSPLLANLMLDDFDHDMEAAGFRLVRFADDFVVLCKDPQQAQSAWRQAEASLQELGLKLDAEKTAITPLEQGVQFLGFIFLNDVMLDVGGGHLPGWLTRLGRKPPQALQGWRQPAEQADELQPVLNTGVQQGQGILLCVTGQHCLIATEQGHAVVRRDEQVVTEAPWHSLQGIILFGMHQLTSPAITQALTCGVGVHFASGYGQYQGLLCAGNGAQGSRLWLKQVEYCQDEQKALAVAQAIVKVRIEAMRESLRLRSTRNQSINTRLEQLHDHEKNIGQMQDISQLNGLEGAATHAYFEGIKTLLPAEFNFNDRNRRPPLDPFNVLLSIGYTVLHGYVETLLRASGLFPWVGFYHQGHTTHTALASDMMECHRDRVENTAITLILRKEISAEDFSYEEGGCIIHKPAHRHFLTALINNFETPVKNRHGESRTLYELLHRQALDLIDWLEGRTDKPVVAGKR